MELKIKNKIRKVIREQIKKLVEMKVTDKDGKDVTSDVIKAMEKRLEKQGYTFTKGRTSDPELRKDDPRYTEAEDRESKQYGYDFSSKEYNTALPSYDGKTATHKIFRKKELAGLFVYVDPSAEPEGGYGQLPAMIVGSSRYRKDGTEWNQKSVAHSGDLGLDTRELKDQLEGMIPNDLGKTVMVSKKFLKTDWTNHPLEETKPNLKEIASKLGYLNEYVVGGKGHAHVFKTDEDKDKLFDFVRSYVSDPDDAERITMQFLGDDKARMPNIDDPGFQKAFFNFMNYEIIGWPKFISGDLDNATIKYKGKTYTNISFEQEDREPRDYAGHITMPIYSYASNKTEDGIQFNVDVIQDGGGSVEEVQWDELEAFTPYKR